MGYQLAVEAGRVTNTAFRAMVECAMITEALAVFNSANDLATFLMRGQAVTSISILDPLLAPIAADTVISIGDELAVVDAPGAVIGSTTIPLRQWTPTREHQPHEMISPPSPANHTARAKLASLVLADPDTYTLRFTWVCAAQGLSSNSPDEDFQTVIMASWDAMTNILA